MSISPLAGAVGVLELEIKVSGKVVPDTVRLVSVDILAGLNTNSSAKIVVLDGDSLDQSWPVLDSEIFEPGNKIQVHAGYGARTDIIYEGVITKLSSKISADNDSRSILECANREKATSPQKVAPHAANIDPVLNITNGEDLMEFSAEYDHELSPFVLDGGNYPDLKNFQFESTRTRGSIQFQGCAGVVPGVTLNLKGVGKRFEGLVFVNAVRHEIKQGNWLTEVEFWRPDSID